MVVGGGVFGGGSKRLCRRCTLPIVDGVRYARTYGTDGAPAFLHPRCLQRTARAVRCAVAACVATLGAAALELLEEAEQADIRSLCTTYLDSVAARSPFPQPLVLTPTSTATASTLPTAQSPPQLAWASPPRFLPPLVFAVAKAADVVEANSAKVRELGSTAAAAAGYGDGDLGAAEAEMQRQLETLKAAVVRRHDEGAATGIGQRRHRRRCRPGDDDLASSLASRLSRSVRSTSMTSVTVESEDDALSDIVMQIVYGGHPFPPRGGGVARGLQHAHGGDVPEEDTWSAPGGASSSAGEIGEDEGLPDAFQSDSDTGVSGGEIDTDDGFLLGADGADEDASFAGGGGGDTVSDEFASVALDGDGDDGAEIEEDDFFAASETDAQQREDGAAASSHSAIEEDDVFGVGSDASGRPQVPPPSLPSSVSSVPTETVRHAGAAAPAASVSTASASSPHGFVSEEAWHEDDASLEEAAAGRPAPGEKAALPRRRSVAERLGAAVVRGGIGGGGGGVGLDESMEVEEEVDFADGREAAGGGGGGGSALITKTQRAHRAEAPDLRRLASGVSSSYQGGGDAATATASGASPVGGPFSDFGSSVALSPLRGGWGGGGVAASVPGYDDLDEIPEELFEFKGGGARRETSPAAAAAARASSAARAAAAAASVGAAGGGGGDDDIPEQFADLAGDEVDADSAAGAGDGLWLSPSAAGGGASGGVRGASPLARVGEEAAAAAARGDAFSDEAESICDETMLPDEGRRGERLHPLHGRDEDEGSLAVAGGAEVFSPSVSVYAGDGSDDTEGSGVSCAASPWSTASGSVVGQRTETEESPGGDSSSTLCVEGCAGSVRCVESVLESSETRVSLGAPSCWVACGDMVLRC